MTDERFEWISKRAYAIWEAAGRPGAAASITGSRRPRNARSWREREPPWTEKKCSQGFGEGLQQTHPRMTLGNPRKTPSEDRRVG